MEIDFQNLTEQPTVNKDDQNYLIVRLSGDDLAGQAGRHAAKRWVTEILKQKEDHPLKECARNLSKLVNELAGDPGFVFSDVNAAERYEAGDDRESLDCGTCDGSGAVDSGGFTPWGTGIYVPCPECSSECPAPPAGASSSSAEDPDEWVILDPVKYAGHVLRENIDFTNTRTGWEPIGIWGGDTVGGVMNDYKGERVLFRCRRHDLPKVEQAEQWPKYWTKFDPTDSKVAYVKQVSKSSGIIVYATGHESDEFPWCKDDNERKQITEAEAMALLKPQPPQHKHDPNCSDLPDDASPVRYYVHRDSRFAWCIKRLFDGTRFDIAKGSDNQIEIDRRTWSEACDRAVSVFGHWMECTIHQAAERIGKDAGYLKNVGLSLPDDFGSRLNLTPEWLRQAAEKEDGCSVSVGRLPPRPTEEHKGHQPPTQFISVPRVDLLNHLLKCIRDQFAEPDSWELGEIIMKEARREGSRNDWDIQSLKLNSFPAGGKWGCCDGKGYLTYELSFIEGKWTCYLHRERAIWMENILNGVKG